MDNFIYSDIQDTCGTDLSGRRATRQMYLLEVFIDKVNIFERPPDPEPGQTEPKIDTKKGLFVKVEFTPDAQFIFRENQVVILPRRQDAPAKQEDGTVKWARTFRVGKSFLFVNDPASMIRTLSKYPLSFELWSDDNLTGRSELLGHGINIWDPAFYFMTKETILGSTPENCQAKSPPLAMKQRTSVRLVCCCSMISEIDYIVRLSALGDCIGTYFQQLLDLDPYAYAFVADNAPSKFECRRVETSNKLLETRNTIYDLTVQADLLLKAKKDRKIQVCTELQSCGAVKEGIDALCHGQKEVVDDVDIPIKSIKMADIKGPCGNANCDIAHRIKNYIRNIHTYKTRPALEPGSTDMKPRRICGKCVCREDRSHRDTAPQSKGKKICPGCGGMAQGDETCEDRLKALHGTGLTPIISKTNLP